jgi:tRNA threonylcarbamoyladenosine biosynthesis protein TsaE
MMELRVRSLAETHAVAAALAGLARAGDLIVLSGEMGAGKTAFAKGFGAALGVTEPITSPTFTLVHRYDLPAAVHGADVLHHADLYRLERTTEVADLALEELADDRGIVLVEWGDVVEALFGDHLDVHLDLDDDLDLDADLDAGGAENDLEAVVDTSRRIEIAAVGPTWASRWSRLVDACEAFAC